MNVRLAETDGEIARCFRVMSQLRPHLLEEEFVARVQRQRSDGFHLAYVERDGEVAAVAGYRFVEMLSRGLFLYVDDLVTDEAKRSSGFGDALFAWLVARARERGCAQVNLDSGVQRFAAHRFYFRNRMHVAAYNFTLPIS